MTQQYDWAEALRKAKYQSQKQQSIMMKESPKTHFNEELFIEQMNYYKTKLTEAIAHNKKTEVEKLIERMIHVHAKHTIFLVQKAKELGKTDESFDIQNYLKKYFSDCTKLTKLLP